MKNKPSHPRFDKRKQEIIFARCFISSLTVLVFGLKYYYHILIGANHSHKLSSNSDLFLAGNPEATPIRDCGICQNNEIYHPAVGGNRGDRKSAS